MARTSYRAKAPSGLTESWGTMSYHEEDTEESGNDTDSQESPPPRRSPRLQEGQNNSSSTEWIPQDSSHLRTPHGRPKTRAMSAGGNSRSRTKPSRIIEEVPLAQSLPTHRSTYKHENGKYTRTSGSSGNTSPEGPTFIMPTIEADIPNGPKRNRSINSPPLVQAPQLVKRKPKRSSISSQPSRRSQRLAAPHKKLPSDDNSESQPLFLNIWGSLILPILGFLGSVLNVCLQMLRPIMVYASALAILFGVGFYLRSLATQAFSSALYPVCLVPGVSYLHLPFCPQANAPTAELDEFEELIKVQSAFEDIIASSTIGATLPIEMKRSEASVRDLRHIVRYSRLPSRNELHNELTGFIDTARQASGDLTKFESRTGRAIDHVLSINRWTFSVLENIADEEARRNTISAYLTSWVYPLGISTRPRDPHDILFQQYMRHTEAVEEQIKNLIPEAQALQMILYNLDDRLEVIAEIAARDGITVKENIDEVFAYIWTKLGGNRSTVAKLEDQLTLLKQLHVYRKQAWNHVTGTLLQLQKIAAGLEDLRERVAAPEVAGPRIDTPLLFHLENIKLGVERLENARGQGRKIIEENVRKYLDQDGQKTNPNRVGGNSAKTISL